MQATFAYICEKVPIANNGDYDVAENMYKCYPKNNNKKKKTSNTTPLEKYSYKKPSKPYDSHDVHHVQQLSHSDRVE